MRLVMIAAAAASLGACASIESTMPTPEAVAEIGAGRSSALIVNMGGDLGCSLAVFGINRAGQPTNEVVTTVFDPGYDTTAPAMIAVPPGRYAFNRGACTKDGYYPAQFPNLQRWFASVEVGENEVVYLGTLNADLVDFSTRSSFDNAFARFWLATPQDTQSSYVLYSLIDDPAVRERISALYPEVAARMVFRAPEQRISNEEFLTLLEQAFAPDAAGVRPTRDEAMVRFGGLLDDRFGAEKAPQPAQPD